MPRARIPALVELILGVVPPGLHELLARLFAQHRFITIDDLMDLVAWIRGVPLPIPGRTHREQLLQCQRQPPAADIELCVAPFPDPDMPPGRSRLLSLDLGSHHQKTAIINRPGRSGRRLRAYVFGTNLHNNYVDTNEHYLDYPHSHSVRNRPWHDAGVVAEGPVANEIEAEFIRRWDLQRNTNYPQSSAIAPSSITHRSSQGVNAELLITAPTPPANNILDSLSSSLRGARTSIYIEDQYFFHADLTEVIIESALRVERAGRTLHIALLTNSPFEFEGDGSGEHNQIEVYRYVNFTNLQLATCDGIRTVAGLQIRRPRGVRWRLHPNSGDRRWDLPNLQIHVDDAPLLVNHGPVTLSQVDQIMDGVRPACAISADGGADLIGRGHSSGEGRQARYTRDIYIYSKITIVDDRVAFIGSSNYSVRSQEYDSEATLKVDNPDFARLARLRLFEEMTGDDYISRLSVECQFRLWNECARNNALEVSRGGTALQGGYVYLVHYPSHPVSRPRLAVWRASTQRRLAHLDVVCRILFDEWGSTSAADWANQLHRRFLELLSPLHWGMRVYKSRCRNDQ